MSNKTSKYGLDWDSSWTPPKIERFMLQHGGYYYRKNGVKCGEGLFFHFKEYWKALFPDHEQTWWTDLILKTLIENRFTGIVGPGSSWKTSTCCRIALMDWSLYPDKTMILMSTTTIADLRSRIYGETSNFWQIAKNNDPDFPGHPVDYLYCIAAHDVDEDSIRDLRSAIIGVPNKTSDGKVQGLSKFVGRKNFRVWSLCDELQFCERSFLEAQNNLSSNGPNLVPGYVRDENNQPVLDSKKQPTVLRGYKCAMIGNPNPDRPENALELVCEPEGGWDSIPDDGKTKTWKAKRVPGSVIQATVINLDGRDGPNNAFDYDKPKWINLVSQKRISEFDPGSSAYWSQAVGVVKRGLAGRKIITRELCDQWHAFDPCVWDGAFPQTKIGALDAGYGGVGGDRCCLMVGTIGKCTDGIWRIQFSPPILVPIKSNQGVTPEDQIAMFCKEKMEGLSVEPNNFFFDGRGTMAMSFAQIWSASVNAIEFGGRPTDRPVGPDYMVIDKKTGERRPKLASDHFDRFVSELWLSWKYCIISDQVRGLTLDTVMDAAPREFEEFRGKFSIETKKDMRVRTGCSPDLADCAAVIVEGARRRGFKIDKLAVQEVKKKSKPSWLEQHLQELDSLNKSKQLQSF